MRHLTVLFWHSKLGRRRVDVSPPPGATAASIAREIVDTMLAPRVGQTHPTPRTGWGVQGHWER